MITNISHTHAHTNHYRARTTHADERGHAQTHYSKIFWQSNYSWRAISILTFTAVTSSVIVSH